MSEINSYISSDFQLSCQFNEMEKENVLQQIVLQQDIHMEEKGTLPSTKYQNYFMSNIKHLNVKI